MSRFEQQLLAVGAVVAAITLAFVIIAQPGCASTPEQREARKAAAVESAKRLAQCAVDGGLACAPEASALVGCALARGMHCETERKTWAGCLQARAIGCGLAAVVGLAGAADGPAVRVSDGCAEAAAGRCADFAGDAGLVEGCLAGEFVPCVD